MGDSHIFPISPTTKGKFLEPKDYIEIAIRYCLLDEDQILNFI